MLLKSVWFVERKKIKIWGSPLTSDKFLTSRLVVELTGHAQTVTTHPGHATRKQKT